MPNRYQVSRPCGADGRKELARLGELLTPSPDTREQEFGSAAQHEASEVKAALGVLETGRNPASPACQERKEKE